MRILSITIILFFALAAPAAEVTLEWTPKTENVDGYRLYQRTDGLQYDYTAPVWTGQDLARTVRLPDINIAGSAMVTASSDYPQDGQTADKAVDGIPAGWPGNYRLEWATDGEGAGAWLRLEWARPYRVDRVMIFDRPNLNDQIMSATLEFSDGSTVAVGILNNDGSGTEINFPARVITGLRFSVTRVSARTRNVGLAEIEVHGVPASDQTRYYFVVRAFIGDKESEDSNEVSFCGGCVPPQIVKNINIKREDEKMYLIADPTPASNVDYFEVELDGKIIRSDPEREGDQVRLHHDLSGISMGQHTARIRGVNAWGEGPWSDPFEFSAELPSGVSGIGLSAE